MIADKFLGVELAGIPNEELHHGFDDPSLMDQRFPSLVLAGTNKVPMHASEWFLAKQDCDGFGCGDKKAAILPLSIKPEIKVRLTNIANENFAGGDGLDYFAIMPTGDVEAIKASYLSTLMELNLTCSERLLKLLTQALYPVDATKENLAIITDDLVDIDLYSENGCELCIFIVGENCD